MNTFHSFFYQLSKKKITVIIFLLIFQLTVLHQAIRNQFISHAQAITPTPISCFTGGNANISPRPCPSGYYCKVSIPDTGGVCIIWPSGSITPPTTVTPSGGSTFISLSLSLHGLGFGGDNVNPAGRGNMNPHHAIRAVRVTISDLQNNLIQESQGSITFDTTSGIFVGTVSLGTLQSGNYLIKLWTNGFLIKAPQEVFHIIQGQTTPVPAIALINGDIDNNNQINIIDYNDIVNCFESKQTTASCVTPPTQDSAGSDIDDNGVIDGPDYNLFLREISVQHGDGGTGGTPTPTPTISCTLPVCPAPPLHCQYQGSTQCSCGTLVCTSPTPIISKDCTPLGSCRSGQVCPTGTVCSALPVYGCYPIGCPYPICLASNTKIATPLGDILVTNVTQGMIVWTVDRNHKKIAVPVVKVTKTSVPKTHQMIHLILSDGREIFASQGHPTADGRTVDKLSIGDQLDGASVLSREIVPYWDSATYDLLPDGETGYYFANHILLGSTLKL